MGLSLAMNKVISKPGTVQTDVRAPWLQFITALEVALIYAGILLYIWRWQFTHPRAWMVLLAIVLVSHAAHRDRLASMGLTLHHLRASAQGCCH